MSKNVLEVRDLKDMLNQTGEVYGDRPAYIFKTEEKGKLNLAKKIIKHIHIAKLGIW